MLKESIDLEIDESNELLFKVQVEGTDVSPARVRLVCEGEELSYIFNGAGTEEPGVVQFDIPNMSGKLKEGIYQASVEVLIDNRYFAPAQFEINFKQPVKVTAESVSVPTVRKKKTSEISVSAAPIVVEKRKPRVQASSTTPQPIQVERKKNQTQSQRPQGKLAQRRAERLRKTGTNHEPLQNLIEDFARDALGKE